MNDLCRWKYNECESTYSAECDAEYIFEAGTPEENGFIYCPNCGKKIAVVVNAICWMDVVIDENMPADTIKFKNSRGEISFGVPDAQTN